MSAAMTKEDDGDDQSTPVTVVGAPERIWLNYGPLDDFEEGEVKHSECDEITWCNDQQDRSDVEYVRADTTAKLQARCEAVEHERDELRARLEAAEKDAARYRWLRDWESRWHEDAPGLTITSGVYQEYEHSTDELDKVIDAALSPTDAGATTRGGGE